MTITYYQYSEENQSYAKENPIVSGILNTIKEQSEKSNLWSLVALANSVETVLDEDFLFDLADALRENKAVDLETCLDAIRLEAAATLQSFARFKTDRYLAGELAVDREIFVEVGGLNAFTLTFDGETTVFSDAERFLERLGSNIQQFADDYDLELPEDPIQELSIQQLEAFPEAPDIHSVLAGIASKAWKEEDTWKALQDVAQNLSLSDYHYDSFAKHVKDMAQQEPKKEQTPSFKMR